jgi:hypothetical protein
MCLYRGVVLNRLLPIFATVLLDGHIPVLATDVLRMEMKALAG